jgi:hypothetical protein
MLDQLGSVGDDAPQARPERLRRLRHLHEFHAPQHAIAPERDALHCRNAVG